MRRSPLLGDLQVDLPKEIGGVDLVENRQTILPLVSNNGSDHSME